MAHRSSRAVATLATGVIGVSCLLAACGGTEGDSVTGWDDIDAGSYDDWPWADGGVDAQGDAGVIRGIEADAAARADAGWRTRDAGADASGFDDAASPADAGDLDADTGDAGTIEDAAPSEPDAGDPASTCPAGTAHPSVCCQEQHGTLVCGEWISSAEVDTCPAGYTTYVDLATCCVGDVCSATP
jgi:hypothetical protein